VAVPEIGVAAAEDGTALIVVEDWLAGASMTVRVHHR
jgi:hypothetical protein